LWGGVTGAVCLLQKENKPLKNVYGYIMPEFRVHVKKTEKNVELQFK